MALENVETIALIFPNVVTNILGARTGGPEKGIDFDFLEETLS